MKILFFSFIYFQIFNIFCFYLVFKVLAERNQLGVFYTIGVFKKERYNMKDLFINILGEGA